MNNDIRIYWGITGTGGKILGSSGAGEIWRLNRMDIEPSLVDGIGRKQYATFGYERTYRNRLHQPKIPQSG